MKKILLMCNSDVHSDPRPNRFINALRGRYALTVLSRTDRPIPQVESVRLAPASGSRLDRVKNYLYSKLGCFDRIIETPAFKKAVEDLKDASFDVVITHNLDLVPLALRLKKNGKVLMDAREYYPHHFQDRFIWRLLVKPYYDHLCAAYLNKVDKMVTVSAGIVREYAENFGVHADLVLSLPAYVEVTPSPAGRPVRIIHHGNASPSRKIEKMIEVMDYLSADDFSLDLMLVGRGSKGYFKKLEKLCLSRKNVKIIPPVAFKDIVTFTSRYDVGLYILPPNSTNARLALPNKLFEFIQARLALAIGPSEEMARIVKEYRCGTVAGDFEPKTMADAISKLSSEDIQAFKKNSDAAARELNAAKNEAHISRIVEDLIGKETV